VGSGRTPNDALHAPIAKGLRFLQCAERSFGAVADHLIPLNAKTGVAPSESSLSKYAIVRTSPSRSCVFGSHPKTAFALEMSGRRCRGSSEGSGSNLTFDLRIWLLALQKI
jgi:hypothetical protein